MSTTENDRPDLPTDGLVDTSGGGGNGAGGLGIPPANASSAASVQNSLGGASAGVNATAQAGVQTVQAPSSVSNVPGSEMAAALGSGRPLASSRLAGGRVPMFHASQFPRSRALPPSLHGGSSQDYQEDDYLTYPDGNPAYIRAMQYLAPSFAQQLDAAVQQIQAYPDVPMSRWPPSERGYQQGPIVSEEESDHDADAASSSRTPRRVADPNQNPPRYSLVVPPATDALGAGDPSGTNLPTRPTTPTATRSQPPVDRRGASSGRGRDPSPPRPRGGLARSHRDPDLDRLLSLDPLDVPVRSVKLYIQHSSSLRHLRSNEEYQNHMSLFARQNKWEEYTGTESKVSLRQWKVTFEETARLLMLPKILWGTGARLQVKGQARQSLSREDPEQDWSYNEMCRRLAVTFDYSPRPALIRRWKEFSQGPKTSVMNYCAKSYDLFVQAFPESSVVSQPHMQDFLASGMIDNALPEIRQMLGMELFTPQTFTEAKDAMVKAEQVLRFNAGIPPARGKASSRSSSMESLHEATSRTTSPAPPYSPSIRSDRPKTPTKSVTFNTPRTRALQTAEPSPVLADAQSESAAELIHLDRPQLNSLQANGKASSPGITGSQPVTRDELDHKLEEHKQAVDTEQSYKRAEAFQAFRRTGRTPSDFDAEAMMKHIRGGPARHLDGRCYSCQERGHIARFCPRFPYPKVNPSVNQMGASRSPRTVATQASYANVVTPEQCLAYQGKPYDPDTEGAFKVEQGRHPLRTTVLLTDTGEYSFTQCNVLTIDAGTSAQRWERLPEDPEDSFWAGDTPPPKAGLDLSKSRAYLTYEYDQPSRDVGNFVDISYLRPSTLEKAGWKLLKARDPVLDYGELCPTWAALKDPRLPQSLWVKHFPRTAERYDHDREISQSRPFPCRQDNLALEIANQANFNVSEYIDQLINDWGVKFDTHTALRLKRALGRVQRDHLARRCSYAHGCRRVASDEKAVRDLYPSQIEPYRNGHRPGPGHFPPSCEMLQVFKQIINPSAPLPEEVLPSPPRTPPYPYDTVTPSRSPYVITLVPFRTCWEFERAVDELRDTQTDLHNEVHPLDNPWVLQIVEDPFPESHTWVVDPTPFKRPISIRALAEKVSTGAWVPPHLETGIVLARRAPQPLRPIDAWVPFKERPPVDRDSDSSSSDSEDEEDEEPEPGGDDDVPPGEALSPPPENPLPAHNFPDAAGNQALSIANQPYFDSSRYVDALCEDWGDHFTVEVVLRMRVDMEQHLRMYQHGKCSYPQLCRMFAADMGVIRKNLEATDVVRDECFTFTPAGVDHRGILAVFKYLIQADGTDIPLTEETPSDTDDEEAGR